MPRKLHIFQMQTDHQTAEQLSTTAEQSRIIRCSCQSDRAEQSTLSRYWSISTFTLHLRTKSNTTQHNMFLSPLCALLCRVERLDRAALL